MIILINRHLTPTYNCRIANRKYQIFRCCATVAKINADCLHNAKTIVYENSRPDSLSTVAFVSYKFNSCIIYLLSCTRKYSSTVF